MKVWSRVDEWTQYAGCLGDNRFITNPDGHTGDDPLDDEPGLSDEDTEEVESICWSCKVRPECIKWALDNEVHSVWVAGRYVPESTHKRALRLVVERLRGSYDDELVARGDF